MKAASLLLLLALLMLRSPRAAGSEPRAVSEKSASAQPDPPVVHLAVEKGLRIGGVPTDLVCDTSNKSSGVEIMLIGEPESTMDELRGIAEILASHGFQTAIPHLETRAGGAQEAAKQIDQVLANYESAVIANGPDAPCSVLRQCGVVGGTVGWGGQPSTSYCSKWTASVPRRFIVLGAGVHAYLELVKNHCRVGVGNHAGAFLIDPDVRPSAELPSFSDCKAGFPSTTVIRTPSGRACHEGFEDLQSGPLETAGLTIHTFPNVGHCDAVNGDATTCTARCRYPRSQELSTSVVWEKVVSILSNSSGGDPEPVAESIETPDYKREYRRGAYSRAQTKFSVALLGGAGALVRSGGDTIPIGIFALRPEILFGRHSRRSLTYGPYIEGGFLGASTMSLGAGLTLLVPFTEHFAVAPSVGVFTYDRHDGWRQGVGASIFVGKRSLEPYHPFDESNGLRIEARTDLRGGHPERAFFASYQVDLVDLALIIGYLVNVR